MGSLLKEMAKVYAQAEEANKKAEALPARNFRPVSELQKEAQKTQGVRKAPKMWQPQRSWEDALREGDFTFDDLGDWAKDNNYVLEHNASGTRYVPKRSEGGFLGIGSQKLSTDKQDAQFKRLEKLAQQNANDNVFVVRAANSFKAGSNNMMSGLVNTGAAALDMAYRNEAFNPSAEKFPETVVSSSDFMQNLNRGVEQHSQRTADAWGDGYFGRAADSVFRLTGEYVAELPMLAFAKGGKMTKAATSVCMKIANGLKIPSHMIPRFISTIGQNYQQEISGGSDADQAALYAVTSAYLTTQFERGGVQGELAGEAKEKVAKNLGEAAWNFLKDVTLQEALEEPMQNIADKATRKAVIDKDAPWFSTKDNNAVINPKREAESAIVGGLAGTMFGLGTGQLNVPKKGEAKTKPEVGAEGADAQSEILPPSSMVPPPLGKEGSVPMTNSEAEAIIKDPVLRAEFEEKSGISLSGMTNAEQRAAVKGYVGGSRLGNSSGIFDDNVGTTKNFATQEDVDAYIDYAYRYSDETKNKGNTEFPKQKSSIVISKVDDRLANDVKENYGVDLTGAHHVLNDNDIRHTKNSHGEETNEKYPVTAEDQKKIPDIVANYDDVIYLKTKGGKEGLYYVKQHNGVTYYLEAIKDGNKVLSNKQMIKVSTGTIPEIPGLKDAIYQKWNIGSAPDDSNIPRMYVQDVKSDVPMDIIPNREPGVKGEVSTDVQSIQNGTPHRAFPTEAEGSRSGEDAEIREELTGGKFVLSDKVDLSHVAGKIDASDKRITDSIVLSHFLGERFGVVTRYIYDPNGRFCGKYDSGAIFINLAKIGNKSSYEVLAHEFGHAFRVINPTKYRELFVLVKNSTSFANRRYVDFRNNVYKKYKSLGREYKTDEIDDVAFSELLSECFAETFKNPESLAKMCEGDEKLHKNLREVILDLIDKVKNFFAGRKNENIRKIVGDFDAIEKKIVEAVNESGYKESFETDGEVRYMATEENHITNEDVQTLQTMGTTEQKSINKFTTEEIKRTENIAKKYFRTIKEKSPFFRAWFGDWREHDQTPITIVKNSTNTKGKIVNKDTGWAINNSSKVENEVKRHNSKGSKIAFHHLPNLDGIIENAILLDSCTINPKSENSMMMHTMYAISEMNYGPELIKLYVEEMYDPAGGDLKRAYKMVAYDKIQLKTGFGLGNKLTPHANSTGYNYTVSDLFAIVKQNDKNFNPKPASNVVNADGTPKVVYHGTDADFTVFDEKKTGSNTHNQGFYGTGFYFSDDEATAQTYSKMSNSENGKVMPVYLSMKKPFYWNSVRTKEDMQRLEKYLGLKSGVLKWTEGYAPYAIKSFENGQQAKAFTEALKRKDFDGIVFEYTENKHEYVVFEPTQIKSATDNIGTFDGDNPDINYMPEGGYFDEDEVSGTSGTPSEGLNRDYGWTDATKRNVKDINELVDMEGNVKDTSKIPTKRKLTRTKATVLTTLDLIDRQIEGCREIMRDPFSPAYKEAEARLDKLYEERDSKTMVIHKTELLQELRGASDGADVQRHGAFVMSAVDEICRGDENRLKRLVKKSSYMLTDFERNMKAIFGKHYGYVKEHFVDPFFTAKAEASKATKKMLAECNEKMKELGISYKSKEDAAVMWIGEGEKAPDLKNEDDAARLEQKMRNMGYRDEEIALHRERGFKGIEVKIAYSEADLYRDFGTERGRAIIEASKFFRQKYDKLIDEINLSQAKIYPNRTDKLVKKRKDYFHHFQEMSQGFGALKNILGTDVGINPLLAGTSEFTQPKEKWAGFKQRRTGNKTEESAIGGFVKYVQDAEYAIHMNEHIEKIRGLARDIAEAKAFEGNTNANAAIIYLKDFANNLAGKTFLIDRIIDRFDGGRKILATIGWFNSRAKANAILGNISTMFVQPTNMLNTLQLIENEGDIARGFTEFIAGLDENSEIAARYKESGFLTERYLDKEINKLTGNSGGAFGRLTGKDLSVWLGAAMNVGDELGTKISWNAFYNEAVRKGEANPSMYADEKTRAAVAGRGIGETPIAFSSKILSLFLPYRVEVNNNINVIRDMLGSDKSAGFKVKKSLEFMITSALVSCVLEAITGNGSVFDPLGALVKGIVQGTDEAEDEEEGTGKGVMLGLKYGLQNLAGEAISNHPLGQAVVSVMGIDSDTLKEWTNGNVYVSGGVGVPAFGVVSNAVRKGSVGGAAIEAALGFGAPFGGNQIKKTAKGIGELARGGAYEKDVLSGKDKGKLKYLVEPSAGNVAKEVLFGPSSLSASKDYYDGKLPKLTERETAQIDENDTFEGRKREYDEITKGKEESAAKSKKKENELKKKRSEYLKNTNSGEWSIKLYDKGFKEALPVELVPETIEWTEKKKEKSVTLTEAERKKYQAELDKLIHGNYKKLVKTSDFLKANLTEKEKMIKKVKSEALSNVKEKIKKGG